ncbi:reticulon-4a isoform X2 [Megalops cyprinoides]|uniref:reticulon-4a isoform X2 n=1 Tax=Megalops cyprinoides TaxID=118141 RepID=UPI001864925D|nr:reticulon-4a isoform X2 [Megalops cyprinoides]
MEQISSTTPPVDELKLHEEWDEYGMRDSHKAFDDTARFLLDKEPAAEDLLDDDILDLAGGARDAIERHKATLPRFEDPPRDAFSDFTLSGPAPSEKESEKASLFGGFGDSTEKQTKALDEVPDTETLEAAPSSREKDSSPPAAPSSLVDLLYWRDLKKTGAVFGASLFLLLSLTVCSIVSICSYVALALLSVTITFRIYKGILQAIQKSEEGHPFKAYLDQDVDLSQEVVHKYSDMTLARINSSLKELRRLFLVEDLVDSLKFAVLMWILTYVGALFNGLTLLILGLISAFSLPVVYEKYQTQIDHYYGLFNNQFKDIVGKIQDKVPGLKRKSE